MALTLPYGQKPEQWLWVLLVIFALMTLASLPSHADPVTSPSPTYVIVQPQADGSLLGHGDIAPPAPVDTAPIQGVVVIDATHWLVRGKMVNPVGRRHTWIAANIALVALDAGTTSYALALTAVNDDQIEEGNFLVAAVIKRWGNTGLFALKAAQAAVVDLTANKQGDYRKLEIPTMLQAGIDTNNAFDIWRALK